MTRRRGDVSPSVKKWRGPRPQWPPMPPVRLLLPTSSADVDEVPRGPCSQDPELWFRADTTAYAAAQCKRCPLIDACRRAAEAIRPEYGVWAGEDYSARRHGSHAAYMRHLETGTRPCGPCRVAHAQHNAKHRQPSLVDALLAVTDDPVLD